MDKPDEKVSIRLLADLLTHLSRRGFIAHDFIKMGWHSVSLGANAPLSMHFKGLSQMGVFEKLIDEVAHVYEENFDYRIVKATSRSIQVRSTLKASKTEDFKTNKVDNLFVSYYRQGVFAAHLKHAGYPIANSTFLSSIHLGHDTEDFSLSW
ncbi:MAG: hypothetical protein H7333_02010 [Bdellovibrionales bacterium]|nr:hypothetical protein [Oligoflexia bacterium]